MAITNWWIAPRPFDISDTQNERSQGALTAYSLDAALAQFQGVPLVYEVRGTSVDLDEFRRLAAAEDAQPQDFVVRSENVLTGVRIEAR